MGIHVDKFLIGVLSAALRRHVGNGSLDDLQQSLLYALSADISGQRNVFRLSGDLIDLVNVDDTAFRSFHIEISSLQQTLEHVFHIVAYVTGFGNGSSVCNGKRHVQNLCQRLCQISLTYTSGAQQQDVALLQFHISCGLVLGLVEDSLIVVIHRHCQRNLCQILTDNVLVQHLFDLCRFQQVDLCRLFGRFLLILCGIRRADRTIEHFVAISHALTTDIHICGGDHAFYQMLRLTAKIASFFLFLVHFSTSFYLCAMTLSIRPYSFASGAYI